MSDLLRFLQNRNSAVKLCEPAPDDTDMTEIFRAAVRVPDHAWLRPWRFITIRGERRSALGEVLAASLLQRKPDSDDAAREKASQEPHYTSSLYRQWPGKEQSRRYKKLAGLRIREHVD